MIHNIAKVRKRRGKDQWAVYSKDGKKLSRWYSSRKKAMHRLGQIEYFKNNAEDQESSLIDMIDHNTYKDVLTTKPIDVGNSKNASLKKNAFGHIINTGNNSVQGDQTPRLDDTTYRFFGGEDDSLSDDKSPAINSKFKDKDLEDLESYLIDNEEYVEASKLSFLRKNAFDPHKKPDFGNLDISKLIPDIDKEILTQEPIKRVPGLGVNIGDPRSVNVDFLVAQVPMLYDAGMDVAEQYYNRMSIGEAMEALHEESKGFSDLVFDSNEERAFAAFVRLLHAGYSCNSAVIAYGKVSGSINQKVNMIFNDQWSDWIIPGLLGAGLGLDIISGTSGWKQAPMSILGAGAAAYGFGGHIMYNLAISKLIPMICKEPMNYRFKNGIFIYEKNGAPTSANSANNPQTQSSSVAPTYHTTSANIPDFDPYYDDPYYDERDFGSLPVQQHSLGLGQPYEAAKKEVGVSSESKGGGTDHSINEPDYKSWGFTEEEWEEMKKYEVK